MGIFATWYETKIKIIYIFDTEEGAMIEVTKTLFDGGLKVGPPKKEIIILHLEEEKVL